MAEIIAERIDFRLIHGQVASKWVRILGITKIVIIDDAVANDDFQKQLLKSVAPAGTKAVIYTIDRALERWNEMQFGTGRVLVLFKTVEDAYTAWERGFPIKELILGQVPGADNRKIAYKTVNLSKQELVWLDEINRGGVNVIFQMVPDETPGSFRPIYDKLMSEFS